MNPHNATQTSYWASFCSMIVAWCDQWITLPNMVMIVAIIIPIMTFVANFYWRWTEYRERRAGLDTRSNQDRRTG